MILFSSTAKGVQLVNVTSSPQLKPTPSRTCFSRRLLQHSLVRRASQAGEPLLYVADGLHTVRVPAALTTVAQAQTYTGKQCTGRIHELYHDEKCAPYDPDAAYVIRFWVCRSP